MYSRRSLINVEKSRCITTCMYVCLESYTKAHVLRGCAHNLGGLKVADHSFRMCSC